MPLVFVPSYRCVGISSQCCPRLFSLNATASSEIYTLSLHDALPIYRLVKEAVDRPVGDLRRERRLLLDAARYDQHRSEEHTSELQSHHDLVCRLLLEKKKNANTSYEPNMVASPTVGQRVVTSRSEGT